MTATNMAVCAPAFRPEYGDVAQTAAVGDDRYSLERRAGQLNRDTHPHVVAAGPRIFGDPDERFADLVAVIVDAAGRMRRTGTATHA